MGANLVHDTWFRRLRASAATAAHRMDDFVSAFPGGPLRVLFEASSPVSLSVFAPLFERLRYDPRLEFWFTSSDESWAALTIFSRAGITSRIITPAEARWAKFDAYI